MANYLSWITKPRGLPVLNCLNERSVLLRCYNSFYSALIWKRTSFVFFFLQIFQFTNACEKLDCHLMFSILNFDGRLNEMQFSFSISFYLNRIREIRFLWTLPWSHIRFPKVSVVSVLCTKVNNVHWHLLDL
mgnify:CR=1 FL=1